MSRPELRAKARFTILAPRSAPAPCAGKADVAGFAAAKAAATKSRAAQAFCGDRLRGHEIRPPPFPRAERGAKIVKRAFARMPAAGVAGPLSHRMTGITLAPHGRPLRVLLRRPRVSENVSVAAHRSDSVDGDAKADGRGECGDRHHGRAGDA